MPAWRRLVGLIGLTIVSVLIVLLALELTLRRWPTLLGSSFANDVSRYTDRSGGIYYFDRSLGMRFMIPNHSTVMSYDGYTWKHRTDSLGFRNEPLHIPADVILMGDSVVYGHGVDFEHTFGRYLEQRSGLRVANLGRQARSPQGRIPNGYWASVRGASGSARARGALVMADLTAAYMKRRSPRSAAPRAPVAGSRTVE